ncbi:hypothetical protein F5X99DRAFT_404601 [Biscogniauxia marginata]|nr:hypothetical protein F5X99DRAFT_404601 [Biscogniauxia marginata]
MNDAIKVAAKAWKDYYDGVRSLKTTLAIVRGLIQAVEVLEERGALSDFRAPYDPISRNREEVMIAGISACAVNVISGSFDILFASLFKTIDPVNCPDTIMSMATGEYDRAIVKNYPVADEHFLISFVMLTKWNLRSFKRAILEDRGPGGDVQPHERGSSSWKDRPQQSNKQKYQDDKVIFQIARITTFYPDFNSCFAMTGDMVLGEDQEKVQEIIGEGLERQDYRCFPAISLALVFRLQLYLVFHRIRRAAFAARGYEG